MTEKIEMRMFDVCVCERERNSHNGICLRA